MARQIVDAESDSNKDKRIELPPRRDGAAAKPLNNYKKLQITLQEVNHGARECAAGHKLD